MKHIISKSLNDIFSKDVLIFILKIGLGSILAWLVILWLTWDSYFTFIASYIQGIPFIGGWEWFQEAGAFISALIIAYMLIIISISTLTSMYSQALLKKLAKKHYPNIGTDASSSMATSMWLSAKAGLIFLVLFIFTFPLIFIPILGQIWMLWLWSILIKEPIAYDVGSLFIEKQKIKKSSSIAMTASLFNYVPVLNIFAVIFAQILFLHHILGVKN